VENNGTVRGQIKWYDAAKGFGFIVAEGRTSDILIHANVLRNFGRNSVAANAQIEVSVQETEKGCQATEIIKIEVPGAGSGFEVLREIIGDDSLKKRSVELLAARVKWFDRGKGFGFVNVFGDDPDIFVHMEVLSACGLSELQSGEAICIRTADGPRGRMAWDVQAWDHAIEEKV